MVAVLVGDVALDGADVNVGVREAGHERVTLEVQRVDPALEGADLAGSDDVLDAFSLDDDGGPLDGLAARAIDQERIGQHGDVCHLI